MGLQKTGQVFDHVQLIDRFIEPNRIFPISDEYRYRYIFAGRDPAGNGFGFETYYGQDFIYKTSSGARLFWAFRTLLPRSFPQVSTLSKPKVDVRRYRELPRALALINHFETDLYENAVVPIALANKYTAISLVPAGCVLAFLPARV